MKPFIYFDLGNVLLNFDFERTGERLSVLTGRNGIGIIEEMFVEEPAVCTAFETGGISTEDFFAFICKRFELKIRIEELAEAYNDIFTPIAGMEPLVADLARQGYRLGVLSNTCEPHWEFCQKEYSLLFSHFNVLCASFELGAMKPDSVIYRKAAQLAGEKPENIIFIDDRSENVSAARAEGFDAVVFQSPQLLKDYLASRNIQVN